MPTDPLATDLIRNPFLAQALALLLLPLGAFVVLFLFGKKLPRHGHWLSIGLGAASFLLALFLFSQIWQQPIQQGRVTWFQLAGLEPTTRVFTAGIYLDNLTALLLVLVTFIALLVQLYSVAYMSGDRHYARYFAFLNLFTFSMTGLVLADNLLVIFGFWELVGFCSYLLIGFWFDREAAARAGKKAFLVNRVGDIALLIGLFCWYSFFGTFDLMTLKAQLPAWPAVSTGLLTVAGLALFGGCVGKSAQFPLQVWLPDAMEGPTPVSALIHAATMVAAGIYLLARCYPFFTPDALLIIAVIGALTALLGALVACTQFDIKRILAYSTVSQLGYMVMGMGVGAHDAALLHLTTHAFFKAALFLNAGIIIHAVQHALVHTDPSLAALTDAQDIRNLGGLRQQLPITFYAYLPAAAALVGVPFFSGFLSKDALLTGAWNWAAAHEALTGNHWFYLVPAVGFLVVALTAYYVVRHLIFIFLGKFRLPFGDSYLRQSAQQEASWLLLGPVVVLGILSLGIFFSIDPFAAGASWVLPGVALTALNPAPVFLAGDLLRAVTAAAVNQPAIHVYTAVLSVLAILVGGGLAWRRFRGNLINTAAGYELSALPPNRFTEWVYHHFYLDTLYDLTLVRPVMHLAAGAAAFDRRVIDYSLNTFSKILVVFAKIIAWFDRTVVDGLVRGSGALARGSGHLGRWMQSGKLQTYYIFSLLGLLLLVGYILFF